MYVCVYMTTQKSYVCILDKNWRTSEEPLLYIPVNEIQLKIAHIHCECTHAFAVPTPTQLECCFFRFCDKKKKEKYFWPLKRELMLNYKLDVF